MGTATDQRWARSILLVEDDEDFRLGLAELLRSEGYLVTCAANGLEALSYLRSGAANPSVVLLDLKMPVMSGWDFRAKMLEEPSFASIPVILLSAALSQTDLGSLHAAASLRKPFDLRSLLTMLDGTLLDRCAVCSAHVGEGRKTVTAEGAIAAVLCGACGAREDYDDSVSRALQEQLAKLRWAHERVLAAR
jgi:CheY-like chemotaxis protein